MNVVHPEFTRSAGVAGLGQGKTLTLTATEAERVSLIKRFDLESLSLFEATVTVRPFLGDARRADWVQANGKLRAEYAQRCVVTLQPVPQKLDLDLNLTFAPMAALADDQIGSEIVIDPYKTDDPDPIENGKIDLGEAMAQQFAIALDPYPKAPGAEISKQYQADGDGKIHDFKENQQESSPFANLAALKGKPKNQG
mgnify:FL=1